MHPDWARSLRDQCVTAGVPFFFKQWGEWLPHGQYAENFSQPTPANSGYWQDGSRAQSVWSDGNRTALKGADGEVICYRIGKRNAGRLLDGRYWNERPEA
jgi:protein gp37